MNRGRILGVLGAPQGVDEVTLWGEILSLFENQERGVDETPEEENAMVVVGLRVYTVTPLEEVVGLLGSLEGRITESYRGTGRRYGALICSAGGSYRDHITMHTL